MALIGPTGSGKTYTALLFARALTDGKILVVDTERSSAALYADQFNKDGRIDVVELPNFAPATYVEAIELAASARYGAVIIDSLSHAWMGKDGALEQVDKIAKRSQSGNSFNAWREVTPMHNQLVDSMLLAPMHVIACMRAKTEYVVETGANGKSAPRKVGLAPIQRDGMEYEFDIVADMDFENNFIVTKTRMAALTGRVINKPKSALAEEIRSWLETGADEAKLTDHRAAYENFRLTDEQAQELIGVCKQAGMKFSAFILEAWNAGDRGFSALWQRAVALRGKSDQEASSINGSTNSGATTPTATVTDAPSSTPTSTTTASDSSHGESPQAGDERPGNSAGTSVGTAPAADVAATPTTEHPLARFNLTASEERKAQAAAKRTGKDLGQVAKGCEAATFAALMAALDPAWHSEAVTA